MSEGLISREIDRPIDYITMSIGSSVEVTLKNDHWLRGKLHAFDEHLNLMLSGVLEFSADDPEEPFRELAVLYVRGDNVVLINKRYS